MKIYTKTGDDGDTGLLGGERVRKDHVRIEAYGAIDELNAFLGVARAEPLPAAVQSVLDRIQQELFVVGTELAAADVSARTPLQVGEQHVAALEGDIDRFEATLPPLRNFILPGGAHGSAALHAARTICRRAERRVVALADSSQTPTSPTLLRYLNRLGDLLFVLARIANKDQGLPDVAWRSAGGRP
jgi:cob(I)alamin adenosyltransferase